MKTKKVLPLILLLFVAIMLFSVGMIAKEYRERQQDIKGFEKLEDIITEVEQTEMTDNVEQTETPQEQKQSTRNLTPLFEANRDCIGWICIPNTAVNYPVMFTPKEPQKYLRKNFEGEYSVSGVPFLDGASTPECDNLIIYGHNMKNGTMFSDITQYRDKAYCEEHPSIEFETADGLKVYQVFAVVCLKKTDLWYNISCFESEEHYQKAITEIKDRSLYDTGIEPQFKEQLLTLSTCFGDSKDSRIVVIGVEQIR